MDTRLIRLTLLGLAAGILLALLLVPQTRWLVRAQLLPSTPSPDHIDRMRRLFVQQHPDDYQIQLGGQTDYTWQTQIAYERSLIPRFPESASLRANILRYAAMNGVHMNRDEFYRLEGQPVPPPHVDPQNLPSTPAQIAAFDADAAAGERLDPDNAYFPFMRAVGLFAAHRDAEGLAAVQRASTKHVWREYFDDEVEGRWRINDAVWGGREAVSALSVSAAVFFPHYADLRSVARLVVYKAVLDEQAGHPEAGLAKREALGRCGELMQTQSTVLIGNLVGGAINAISRSRPGGDPALVSLSHLPGNQQMQLRLKLYCDYVQKIGHPEAAAEAQADQRTWQQVHSATAKVTDYAMGSHRADLMKLGIALPAGWVLLPNLLLVFLLGVVGAGLMRLPRFQQRQPLPPGVTIGFWSVVTVSFLLPAIFVTVNEIDFEFYEEVTAVVALITLAFTGIAATFRPRLRRPFARVLLAAAATVGALGLWGLFVFWQIHGGIDLVTTLQQMSLVTPNDPETGASSSYSSAEGMILIGTAFSLAVPLLCAVILSIVSRIKHVPVSVGLAGGFRAVMPLLVFGLMLVYGGLTLWTVRQETRVNYGLERSMHGEGQYLAQITGETWPSR